MYPVLYVIMAALVVVPFWMILPRTGLAPWWSLVAAIPLGAVVLLWVMALRRWPGDAAGQGG